jgi:hypothetical protein
LKDEDWLGADGIRRIFKVKNTVYSKESFKKSSRIYLRIQPVYSGTFYIKHIALYRKSYDKSGKIIVPDGETEATEWVNSGVMEHKYHYFSPKVLEGDEAITDKEQLQTVVRDVLDYTDYKPVYNEGAKKIRSVSAKESNYFNILQSIAETFEAWLELAVERNKSGQITKKIAKFKNYAGDTNYANFRYGLNLNDIQRTYASKNLVTKLIVKQNSNELAEDGFCTIQRAGANPTGENYMYDFQYYQNTEIMPVDDFLDTVYYLDGAAGEDAELWGEGGAVEPASGVDTTLNGYYPRIKKLNDAIIPINEDLIGLNQELVEKKAQLEVELATKEVATSSIEETRENFLALTGLYPEDARTEEIEEIVVQSVEPCEDWFTGKAKVDGNVVTTTLSTTTRPLRAREFSLRKTGDASLVDDPNSERVYRFASRALYGGVYVVATYKKGKTYVLEYDIMCTTNNAFDNIGCDITGFDGLSIEVTQDGKIVGTGKVTAEPNEGGSYLPRTYYHVKVVGTISNIESKGDSGMWI